MRLERKALLVSILSLAMLGIAVVPGLAAPEKQFTIAAPASIAPGTQNIGVVVRNTTPNGNSNISSLILRSAGPTGWQINNLVGPGNGSVSAGGTTISINGFSPIKPDKSTTFTLNVTAPNLGCDGGTVLWYRANPLLTPEAFTGNSFGGDAFNFKLGVVASGTQPATNTTTAIQSSCSSITVTKHEDPNFNGTIDAGEDALPGWEFQLEDGNGDPIGGTEETDENGEITYVVPAGDYTVCETDDRANPDAPGYGDTITAWVNTAPGGDRCADVTLAAGESETIDFLNALGTLACTGDNSTDTETGGGTTVDLSRGANSDGSACILVPYQLTADTDIVTFIKDLSVQDHATFKLVITWGIPADDYPDFGTTTFDLDGNFETGGDTFIPDNCLVVGGEAQVPINPNAAESLASPNTVKPWCHAGTTVLPVGTGYEVTETFLGGGDPTIVRQK